MKNHPQSLSLCAGSTLLISTLFSSGCASDTSPNTQQGAVAGAIAGAVIGGIIGHQSGETDKGMAAGAATGAIVGAMAGNEKDRRLSEIQYERRIAEETSAREHAEENARRQHNIAVGKSVEDQEILDARRKAEAAEAEVARLRAEEALAIKKAKQLDEYKAREAAAKAEADRIRNGQ